jgi:hypothetical protein
MRLFYIDESIGQVQNWQKTRSYWVRYEFDMNILDSGNKNEVTCGAIWI